MIPKRILLENFLSFGAPAVELAFADDEPLWALCGRNGVGKSAVFDAITYALYGEHRGGAQKPDQLIRHGANSFRIVFEFEFAGALYRVTRSREKRTTQKVEQIIDGQWEAVPDINSASDVKNWVQRTLGLGYDAFTTSILLRQGEAEKLFTASRDDRIKLLKGIIGFERFEEISKRVHDAAWDREKFFNSLTAQRNALQPVTAEELATAEEAVQLAAEANKLAQEQHGNAIRRVEHARQWFKLETERNGLEKQLRQAEERAEASQRIRDEKALLDDLTAAVPALEKLFDVRSRIAELAGKRDTANNALSAQKLAHGIKKGELLLIEVADLECLEERLREFPQDLDEQLAQAHNREHEVDEEKSKHSAAKTRAETLLEQARDRHSEFADVTVGAKCSRCGQFVDASHAEQERQRLAEDVQQTEKRFQEAKTADAAAQKNFGDVRKQRQSLEKCKEAREKLAADRNAKTAALSARGEFTTAVELRARLAALHNQHAAAQGVAGPGEPIPEPSAADAKRLQRECNKLELEVGKAQSQLDELERNLNRADGEETTLLAHLSDFWKDRLATLDGAQFQELAATRDELLVAGVAEQFKALEQDDLNRANWTKHLDGVKSEIDDLPEDARIPVADAQALQTQAKTAADQAAQARDLAIRTRDNLQSQADQLEKLTEKLRNAEYDCDLHKKLDALLGQNGLQRELVRDAEQQIVELANDTLQNLSDGDLALEQDDEAAGRDDKAFALRVRKPNEPIPTGVLFLSGSQKFRVAVSVALAVGRFASGRARPLEAVIIDEGFGSLDKDGLRAMADELKRLQRTEQLKRVILVSHQEEFTDQFPVGYQLTSGENGAIATPFRR
jgi:DNA repair exonuclease SbcCD ATPase subunit